MFARMQTAWLAGLFVYILLTGILAAELPKEPVETGFEPQFLFGLYPCGSLAGRCACGARSGHKKLRQEFPAR